MMIKKYISDKGEDAIRNFKYKGGSVSYSYKYVWSPVAQFVLKYFIPETWAPNVITVVGILISIFGCVCLAVQGTDSYLIPWTLLLFGLCIFIYQTLDNVDGKQARRTQNSSPLGMLMDHGCDALGVSFLTLGVATLSMVQSENEIIFTAQMGVLFGFWSSCWAQYHSKGILILGRVNAVDDGIPTVGLLGFFTFFVGQDFWITPFFQGITPQLVLTNGIRISALFQIFSLVKNAGDNFTKDYVHAFSHLIHMVGISLSLLIIATYTNWHQEYFYPIYFCMTFTMVRDISYLQMCVVAEQKYEQFQSTVLMFIFGFPTFILLKEFFGIVIISDYVFVHGMLLFFGYKYFHFIVCAVLQISNVLGIKVFQINKKKIK